MSWLRFGKGLLAVGILFLGTEALADYGDASPSRADYAGCGSPCGAAVSCAPAPYYTTVTVCEMVPVQEQVQVTRYRMEAKQETFTAYKTELVPEQRTRTYTVMVPKTETVQQTFTR